MRQGHTVWEVIALQKAIWSYHANLDATHNYFSPWWTWPWLVRPTWYFWWSGDGVVRGIVALGNPAVWWVSVPVSLWAVATGVRWRDPRRVFAGAGFFLLYLPWGLSPRTLNFSHYLFEAIPYACLSLGILLDRDWDGRHPLLPRGYVLLVIALFLLFLPFLTAMTVLLDAVGLPLPVRGGPVDLVPALGLASVSPGAERARRAAERAISGARARRKPKRAVHSAARGSRGRGAARLRRNGRRAADSLARSERGV